MNSTELGPVGIERRRYAVKEVCYGLARLCGGFVLRASLCGGV